ncbi:DUF1573 domain-containing protein [Crocinitomix sp.]|nr:DUF1573 domain-containing protein [Crocinitomix sp.]
MKNLLLIIVAAVIVQSCTTNQAANAEERKTEFAKYVDEPTEIMFEDPIYNFGTVVDGEMVKKTFKFTNTGEKNLVLFNVQTTCGCTVPEDWPKQPIAPGESGEVKVIFNSSNKVGSVNKSIRVEANTNPTVTTISIVGEVKE